METAQMRRYQAATAQIRADVADGKVPATVRTFAELHDYVDANEYGNGTGTVRELDAMQGMLDRWIRVGSLRLPDTDRWRAAFAATAPSN